jgi:hypothetical protein
MRLRHNSFHADSPKIKAANAGIVRYCCWHHHNWNYPVSDRAQGSEMRTSRRRW